MFDPDFDAISVDVASAAVLAMGKVLILLECLMTDAAHLLRLYLHPGYLVPLDNFFLRLLGDRSRG